MKKIICFLLAIILLHTCVVEAAAYGNDEIMPLFENISSVYACLSIDQNLGITTCTGRIIAKDMYPVSVDVILQVKENGRWSEVCSWSASGTYSASCTEYRAVYSGYDYRVLVFGYVHDANGRIIESGSAVHEVSYPQQ